MERPFLFICVRHCKRIYPLIKPATVVVILSAVRHTVDCRPAVCVVLLSTGLQSVDVKPASYDGITSTGADPLAVKMESDDEDNDDVGHSGDDDDDDDDDTAAAADESSSHLDHTATDDLPPSPGVSCIIDDLLTYLLDLCHPFSSDRQHLSYDVFVWR